MEFTRRTVLAATGSSIALGLAGCLGEDGSDGDGGSNDDFDATVNLRSHGEFGDILVDDAGMTLYRFDADTQGSGASACSGSCLDAWPPLTASGDPTAGDGVSAELTTFERDDGTTHVAADGWPLYYFASDGSPGDTNGQGVEDVWWVVAPDGAKITAAADDSGRTY